MPDEQPDSHDAASGPENASQAALARDVATLVATVDQHSAEIDAAKVQTLLFAFALGCLAGIVFLHGRELRELTDAVTR